MLGDKQHLINSVVRALLLPGVAVFCMILRFRSRTSDRLFSLWQLFVIFRVMFKKMMQKFVDFDKIANFPAKVKSYPAELFGWAGFLYLQYAFQIHVGPGEDVAY
jgi:hypothetical protein